MLALKTWIRAIIAYLIAFAVYNIGEFESTDILLGVIFSVVYLLLGATKSKDSVSDLKRVKTAAGIVAIIWTILYAIYLGGAIKSGLENPLFAGVYIVLTVTGLYIGLYYSLRYIMPRLLSLGINRKIQNDKSDTTDITESPEGARCGNGVDSTPGFPWKIWLIYAGIIFVCMLPLFFLNYPGTMTVDSFDQFRQARGVATYSDHHPWVHTLIIQALYSVGYSITGSINGGIATYTLAQMIILALSVSYAIASMSEAGIGRTGRILMLLGFILYPYNLAYSITMWKDVLFAASVLVLTVTVYRVYVIRNELRTRDIVLLSISGLLMCLLRHNGLYAYILTMILIILRELILKKRPVVTIAIVVCTLAAVALVRGPIQRANNVEAGDFAHNIPIPLQQIGRVVYDRCKLTDDEIESILRINTIEYIWEEYTPGGADPMIQWVMFGDHKYLLSHRAEYISLWLHLGLKYPGEYLKAYIDQTKGYYTTMAPEQTEYYGILPNADSLENKPIFGAGIRIKVNEICSKLYNMFPIYAILYGMGACFMLLILGAALALLQNNKAKILTYMPVIALTLTLLAATPLCADLRYAYPLMLCMPMLICITLKGPCHE